MILTSALQRHQNGPYLLLSIRKYKENLGSQCACLLLGDHLNIKEITDQSAPAFSQVSPYTFGYRSYHATETKAICSSLSFRHTMGSTHVECN